MPIMFKANPKVDQLRARLGHPIVDADAHQIGMGPMFLDFLREAGAAKMPHRSKRIAPWPENRWRHIFGMIGGCRTALASFRSAVSKPSVKNL
jgi:hypothetical protein